MPSLYRIYFSRDSTVLSLPINPEKLPETKESDNGEYNVLGLGPVMQPRTPKLRKVTISGLFPGRSAGVRITFTALTVDVATGWRHGF